MVRIAADENLHMVFYRDILSAALVLEPSAAVCAIVDEVLDFQMPGAGIPGFIRKAAQIAKAGIYDIRVHREEVLMPIIRHWRIFELTNLDAKAEEARTRLAEHLAKLDVAARRFEERRKRLQARAGRDGVESWQISLSVRCWPERGAPSRRACKATHPARL